MTMFRAPIHLYQGVWEKLEDKSIPAFKNEKLSALFKHSVKLPGLVLFWRWGPVGWGIEGGERGVRTSQAVSPRGPGTEEVERGSHTVSWCMSTYTWKCVPVLCPPGWPLVCALSL